MDTDTNRISITTDNNNYIMSTAIIKPEELEKDQIIRLKGVDDDSLYGLEEYKIQWVNPVFSPIRIRSNENILYLDQDQFTPIETKKKPVYVYYRTHHYKVDLFPYTLPHAEDSGIIQTLIEYLKEKDLFEETVVLDEEELIEEGGMEYFSNNLQKLLEYFVIERNSNDRNTPPEFYKGLDATWTDPYGEKKNVKIQFISDTIYHLLSLERLNRMIDFELEGLGIMH